MAGIHPQQQLIEELRQAFRIKWGGSEAEFRMAEEMVHLNMLILKYEDRIKELEADRHLAFHREPPRSGGRNE